MTAMFEDLPDEHFMILILFLFINGVIVLQNEVNLCIILNVGLSEGMVEF